MRNYKASFIIRLLPLAIFGALLSCAMDQAPADIENSLPQNELAYYNDSFDKMREDLWDRGGYLYREEQMQNFAQADMRFENGKLILRTKTGSFSKGSLGSNFEFRGDFDIQIDCRIVFIKATLGMDQLLNVMVFDKSNEIGKADLVVILLFMGEGGIQGRINSRGFINSRWYNGIPKRMDNFDGTLRFVRKGKKISTFSKKLGASKWNKMRTFQATDKDLMFGFQVRNFFNKRTTIEANQSISAEFDNFEINAAHQIIEGEI